MDRIGELTFQENTFQRNTFQIGWIVEEVGGRPTVTKPLISLKTGGGVLIGIVPSILYIEEGVEETLWHLE